jgi:hypothetical protein
MSYRSIFDAKTTSETVAVSFDFSSDYAVGETCSSGSVTATVYSGTDAAPSGIVSGAAGFTGAVATQTVVGGVAGVTYLLTATTVSSLGKTRSRSGYLSILG